MWSNTRTFFERSASGESQVLQQHLAGMFVKAGEALAGDFELRAEINEGFVTVLRSFIADQKSGVSSFISDQVKGWDMMFEPAESKIYRHPTFYDVPEEVGHM